jgi:hypothetical protein
VVVQNVHFETQGLWLAARGAVSFSILAVFAKFDHAQGNPGVSMIEEGHLEGDT